MLIHNTDIRYNDSNDTQICNPPWMAQYLFVFELHPESGA